MEKLIFFFTHLVQNIVHNSTPLYQNVKPKILLQLGTH